MLKKCRKKVQGFLAVILLLQGMLVFNLRTDAADMNVAARQKDGVSLIAYEILIEEVTEAEETETPREEEIRMGAKTSDPTERRETSLWYAGCGLGIAALLLAGAPGVQEKQKRKRVSRRGGKA